MVSWAEIAGMASVRRKVSDTGLRGYFGVPASTQVYLDNGSYYFLSREVPFSADDYSAFAVDARPDWKPIPRDIIPTPRMSPEEQRACFEQTMEFNRAYRHDGYVPVAHVSSLLPEYIDAIKSDSHLRKKPSLALGGIVPNLLRTSRARPYDELLRSIGRVRDEFADKSIHLFGVGGTATLHVARLLGIDSVDSSGWRNRAARGIVQLPGTGDRTVADLGRWRGRQPSISEWHRLHECPCPGCTRSKSVGLQAKGVDGFAGRAIHNLWTLLEESRQIEEHLASGTYLDWYPTHLDSTVYRPLIDRLVDDPFASDDRSKQYPVVLLQHPRSHDRKWRRPVGEECVVKRSEIEGVALFTLDVIAQL